MLFCISLSKRNGGSWSTLELAQPELWEPLQPASGMSPALLLSPSPLLPSQQRTFVEQVT